MLRGETMPWIFCAIGAELPTTYYIELQRTIVLRGASLRDFCSISVSLPGWVWGDQPVHAAVQTEDCLSVKGNPTAQVRMRRLQASRAGR
jgi:hypothetical protein